MLSLVEHPNMVLTLWSLLLGTIKQVEAATDDHCMTIIINQDSDTGALNVSYSLFPNGERVAAIMEPLHVYLLHFHTILARSRKRSGVRLLHTNYPKPN